MSDLKMNFVINLELKLFRTTIANADIGRLNFSPYIIFDTCLATVMLVKFEHRT